MRISQFPKGFVGLLGVQDAGRSPADLAETVSPIVDFTELYIATTQITAASSGNSPWAIGTVDLAVTIPQSETWLMKGVHLRMSVPAGGLCSLSAHAIYPNTTGRIPLVNTFSAGNAAAINACSGEIFPSMLLLPGGTEIYVSHDIGIGAGASYFLSLMFCPLRQSV